MAKKAKRKVKKKSPDDTVGKRVVFDRATWGAVDLMAREQMKDLPDLIEEAFRDLLKKYGRTADFREALKLSARRAKK
jgi:hypothetical protein